LREFGSLEFEVDSKSTLLALGIGCVIGLLIYFCSDPTQKNKSNNSFKLYLSLLIASAVSILPFMLTGRNVFEHELNTRYFIPAIPMAIIGILVLMSMLISGKAYRIFLLSLAFLSGSVTVTYMTKILRHEQRLAALSPELQSFAGGDGITVFVLAREKNSAISLTGKITSQWSGELREKTWIIPETEAFELYGTRKDCTPPETINLDHRKLLRQGLLKTIYNVDALAKNEILVEPFCKPQT